MDIIAHRGASTYAPENTIAAFQRALDQQADGIELDVRLTKDDIPVICHDATINRTSNGKGSIHSLPLQALKKYDFGSYFHKKYKKETIPTLEEVLQLTKNSDTTLHIELKNGPVIPKTLEQRVLELIFQYGMQERVVYSSFDHLSLQRVVELDPQAKIGLIFHMNLVHLFDYIAHTEIPVHSIHPNHFYVTDEMVQQAHKRGMRVNLYTVNNRKLAETYKKMGVDGIITNDPLLFS